MPEPESQLREILGIPQDAEKIIIFAESSHWDPNWLKTSEQYYDEFIQNNLDQALAALEKELPELRGKDRNKGLLLRAQLETDFSNATDIYKGIISSAGDNEELEARLEELRHIFETLRGDLLIDGGTAYEKLIRGVQLSGVTLNEGKTNAALDYDVTFVIGLSDLGMKAIVSQSILSLICPSC